MTDTPKPDAPIEPLCKRMHHWGSFRPMPTTDPITKNVVMVRMCPYCSLTMAEYSKTRTPDRIRRRHGR